MAILDYVNGQSMAAGRNTGLRPSYEVWGTVLAKGKDTKAGSLRVKIATMANGKDTFEDVPYLSPYGGKDYGLYFMPEEGDTVLVKFVGEDLQHPVAYGCRFRQDSVLVKNSAEDKNLKKICKVKNGSSASFEGEPGKEKITVATSKKLKIEMNEEQESISVTDNDKKNSLLLDNKNGRIALKAEKEITLDCGKCKISIKENGTIRIECNQVEIEAKTVAVKGKSKIDLQSQEVTMKGSMGVAVEGKSKVQIKSSGQIKVSGAMINLN